MIKHVHRHEFTDELWEQAKFENLSNLDVGTQYTLDHLKLRTTYYAGARRIVGPCPICGATAPRKDPNLHPVVINRADFACPGSGFAHRYTLRDLVVERFPKKPARLKFLKSFNAGNPELLRSYVLETLDDDDQRGVDEDPDKALEQLTLSEDATAARGVLMETPTLAIAKQLAGQVRNKLPWCEEVPINEFGKLGSYIWHGHWLTEQEKLRQTSETIRASIARRKQAELDIEQYAFERRMESL